MDSHSFSEPELISSEPIPTWRVFVLRRGVDDPIDTLELNDKTLPPRKNKAGKVVWKLPNDSAQVPKFGVLEQKRLWELFKEQRKLRRKKLKEGGDDCNDRSNNEPTPITSDEEDPGKHKHNNIEAHRDPQPMTQLTREGDKLDNNCNGTALPNPPPPPGFGTPSLASLSLNGKCNSPKQSSSQGQLPGPPGITTLGPPVQSPVTVAPSMMSGEPPPGIQSISNNPLDAPVAHLPSSYFTLSPVELMAFPNSLAARVATTFVQLVANRDLVPQWLAYYAPSAQSTLVMGTAQAVASSFSDKLRQWQSLTSPPPSSPAAATNQQQQACWECHGWTAQTLLLPPQQPLMVLIVLTGRTLQQHPLAFQMTLILQQQLPLHNLSTATTTPPPPPPSYQIVNEVLGLSLLS